MPACKTTSLSPLSRLVLLSLLLLTQACGSGSDRSSEAQVHAVSSLRIELQESYRAEYEYAGVLRARQHDDIGFELGGTVLRMLVDEGDRVGRGQLLAELDTQLLEIDRKQLEAQVTETDARVKLNAANLKREQSLKRSGFAAEQRLDELRSEQEVLQATIARLQANLDSIEVRLSKSRLTAPFDGIVSRRYRDTGAAIVPGTPVLRLLESGSLEAWVGIPARLIGTLEPGSDVVVMVDDQKLEGKVAAVGADLDPVTRTAAVRVTLPPSSGAAEGELARLRLSEDIAQGGAWVPFSAVTDGVRGLWVVYVLVPDDAERFRIEARDVSIRYSEGERVFISGAVHAGELVVSTGLHRVAPGQLVRLESTAEA
jgi:RND family efflux transporter MFP subunit